MLNLQNNLKNEEPDKVVIQVDDDFDMHKIAESGQCFRWEMQRGKQSSAQCAALCAHTILSHEPTYQVYRIIAGKSCLYISELGNGRFELDCTEEEYNGFWRDYFDLQMSYRSIRRRIDPAQDPFLWEAAEHEKGIRILRQDPWEMLITFIISQNRNIPAIRRSVELLAEACGEKKTDSRGLEYYAFPGPAAVANLSEEALSGCRLGYRCRYVHAAAEAAITGAIDLKQLREADEETTMAALTGLYGVGKKVANCVSLFGLHHIDAFPIDVWMKRVLAEQYPEGFPFEKYSPYNGIYQQYLFAYYRHQNTAQPASGIRPHSLTS